MTCGVYMIQCVAEGAHQDKVYVGSSNNIEKRWSLHKHHLKHKTHHSAKLQEAHDIYGSSSFVWAILETCEERNLIELEQVWMDCNNAAVEGFNVCVAAGRNPRRPVSQETRDKLRAAQTGKRYAPEVIERMRRAASARVTPETRARMSEAHKGVRLSKVHIERRDAPRRGKPQSPEHIAKRTASSMRTKAAKATLQKATL